MMMNGELMSKATGGQAGSFLADAVEKSKFKRNPAHYVVERLYSGYARAAVPAPTS